MSESEHPLGKRYPELRLFTSREEANAAFKECQKSQAKTLWFWVGMIGYTCGLGLTVAVVLFALRPWLPLSPAMFGGVVGGLTGGTGTLVLQWFWRSRFRMLLRQRLIASGVPICLTCGYDLRGQVEPRCPECGTPFDSKLLTEGN